jgi:hypothetical protein
MTSLIKARELLSDALQLYSAADSEAKIEQAVLALHTGLEEAFRAYLTSAGYREADHINKVSLPDLVDMIAEYTGLFDGDPGLPRLLTALNNTRVKIAHPRGDKPSPQQIANDAQQLANLAHRFWPGLFGELYPYSTVAPRPGSVPRIEQPPRSPSVGPETQRPAPSSKLSRLLRALWRDEFEPRFRVKLFLKRLIGAAILFVVAGWCKSAAMNTARWPEPVKYGGVLLFLAAIGLFLWGIVVVWRLVRQLRVRGLVILLGVSAIALISVSVLTSESPLPIHQEVLSTTRRLLATASHKAHDIFETLVEAPGEFRFAYTGQRRPLQTRGTEVEDTSLLTPIPANYPVQLQPTAESSALPTKASATAPVGTPSPSSVPATPITNLLLPNCPHPQARLTAPRVNQVVKEQIQAEGTASIDNFDYYKFEIRREDANTEDDWHWIGSFETPVEDGTLGNLSLSGLPEGVYTLRLTVVNREGNYPFPPCEVRIHVKY